MYLDFHLNYMYLDFHLKVGYTWQDTCVFRSFCLHTLDNIPSPSVGRAGVGLPIYVVFCQERNTTKKLFYKIIFFKSPL